MHSGKQMPSILYKYRTFSPYTIPMLSSQTVWYAIPNTLNDPFDCKATLIGLGADTRRALDWERQSRLAGVLLALGGQGLQSQRALVVDLAGHTLGVALACRRAGAQRERAGLATVGGQILGAHVQGRYL